jgi:hypothetical protein
MSYLFKWIVARWTLSPHFPPGLSLSLEPPACPIASSLHPRYPSTCHHALSTVPTHDLTLCASPPSPPGLHSPPRLPVSEGMSNTDDNTVG